MNVKICGIKTIEAATCSVENGAKAIGFVFAESKRKITPEKAKEIIDQLPKELVKVGVFVNETKETIDEIVRVSGINVIQLHGDESPEFVKSFNIPVIKAFSIATIEDLENVREYACEYILLDSPRGKYHGGNGIAFDWSLLNNQDFQGKKVILAGGLNIENLQLAKESANPYMLDVSSGVETNGEKDFNKIKEFLQKAMT
ncbi:phosphoribosylanthranilate isomerase [Bacillus sp. B1-b2]|uniref:phosphoribosylanthranilate isomerase n=1 Tax=Bacillus sp. B1-b2 TaxID=2653201 RepID=UPI0012615B9A|nr:phosphoribosylanthranilate isomerase [Bacillus sp. B1-b2]KAB7673156.1 phosphoribosylanthranilate isomerase [Bacillus sp. B1-b2]